MLFCEHLHVSGYQGSAGGRYTCRSSNYRRERRRCVWSAARQQPTQPHARRKQAPLGQDEGDNRRNQSARTNAPIQTKASPPDPLPFCASGSGNRPLLRTRQRLPRLMSGCRRRRVPLRLDPSLHGRATHAHTHFYTEIFYISP